MKNILKILIITFAILGWILCQEVSAWIINLEDQSISTAVTKITDSSIKTEWTAFSDTITWASTIETITNQFLVIIKRIINALLVFFIVFAWVNMVLYNGEDENKLTAWKTQITYSVAWLFFLNIPWTLANIVNTSWGWWSINSAAGTTFYGTEIQMLFNMDNLWAMLWSMLIPFLEVAIWVFATSMLIITWIRIILDRGKGEALAEWKNKVIYSIFALIFVWFIEIFKAFVIDLNVSVWQNIGQKVANMMLFFIWPAALTAFIYAWYLFITANWDDNKAWKWKTIIINTVLWIILAVASWSIVKEIVNFWA